MQLGHTSAPRRHEWPGWGGARSELRASNQHCDRDRIGSARQRRGHCNRVDSLRAVMLGTPPGPWAAHVVALRPVRIEQGFDQIVQELANVCGKPRLKASST